MQTAARELLGKRLVRHFADGSVAEGIILETEAYDGEQDLACHARSGQTKRNAMMYGTAGHAYIYFTYGIHWLLNCVCGADGYPAAALIRAIHPLKGLGLMRSNRPGIKDAHLCDGPAKLTQALGITGGLNGVDLCAEGSPLTIEECLSISDDHMITTPRIGIPNTPEPWLSQPWRFLVNNLPDFEKFI